MHKQPSGPTPATYAFINSGPDLGRICFSPLQGYIGMRLAFDDQVKLD